MTRKPAKFRTQMVCVTLGAFILLPVNLHYQAHAQPVPVGPPDPSQPAPPPCTFGRKYTFVLKNGDATGCSAKIRTRAVKLCGEDNPNVNMLAASAAWAGVEKRNPQMVPVLWAQMGYAELVESGSQTVSAFRYAEIKYGTGPNDIDRHDENGIPSGTHEYRLYLQSQLFGIWKFEFDGLPFHTTENHPNWRNVTGTTYTWAGEIFNKEDDMVGTASAKCDYTQCKYALNWEAFQNANIGQNDPYSDDQNEWGIERVSATAINVWDKNPNP